MGFGGSQDKNGVGWRFLKSLEQGIGGFFGEHMNLIDNIDLVMSLVGSVVDPFAEVSDVINTAVAGSINLDNIQSPTLGYCLAHGASIAWFSFAVSKTIHCLSQNAPGAGLTGSSWAAKKVGMRYTPTAKGME